MCLYLIEYISIDDFLLQDECPIASDKFDKIESN